MISGFHSRLRRDILYVLFSKETRVPATDCSLALTFSINKAEMDKPDLRENWEKQRK